MIKNKIIPFTIFIVCVILSLVNFLPVAHGIDATISDAEDDVLQECTSGNTAGDYHDEIDIIKLTITGKNVNLTVAGNLAKWNSSYYGSIIFSETFYPSDGADFSWTPPYFSIDWNNYSGSIEVTLERGYSLGGGNFAYEEWNGTGWEDRTTATAANIVIAVTEHSIISYIPDQVETIPSSMRAMASTLISIYGSCDYKDITPIPSSAQNIPSYNLFILICTMTGISIILVKKHEK